MASSTQSRSDRCRQLEFQGTHRVNLRRQDLWRRLNDAAVLQHCMRGCSAVEKRSDDEFCASFQLKFGPLKKTFDAHLEVVDCNAPQQYQLKTTMQSGIAGSVAGFANVQLKEVDVNTTDLSYQASIDAAGWIGEIGTRLLGGTAEKYIHEFFEKLSNEID